MTIEENVATATLGPFPPGTVGDEPHEIFVTVITVDTDGRVAIVRPPVASFQLLQC